MVKHVTCTQRDKSRWKTKRDSEMLHYERKQIRKSETIVILVKRLLGLKKEHPPVLEEEEQVGREKQRAS